MARATTAHQTHHPNYMGVFLGLALLTGAELGVAFLPWPKRIIVLILIALALWKALLVALYYMHLRFEPNRLRLLVIAPLPLAVIMVVAVLQEFT
jgi:cytochrome c oxidase subunit 4